MSSSSFIAPVIPSSREFCNQLPHVAGNSAEPLHETLRAAANFKEGDEWIIDNNNCDAALLALTERQPGHLRLIARADARNALPVAALVKAITRCGAMGSSDNEDELDEDKRQEKRCLCHLDFYDTFYTASDVATDRMRLQHITANPSLELGDVIGHLDSSTIAKLRKPGILGLAIGSAADAAAVGRICWQHAPIIMHVSMTARVAAEDLEPLSEEVSHYGFHVPFLTDDRVESLRPAIEALWPKRTLWSLYIPKSKLTSLGLWCLIEQLRGLTISYRIVVEMSGTWQPEEEEKENVATELRSATGCAIVKWGI